MKNQKRIGPIALTHGGVFHVDDVFSAALLKILNPEITIQRVLSVPEDVSETTIVFDIGFGQFDHHQKDGDVRENGIKYAAFGLLWKEFGSLLVNKKSSIKFDFMFIQDIDNSDNGGKVDPMSYAVSAFVPYWDSEDQDMDKAFERAVDFAKCILEKSIAMLKSEENADALVAQYLEESEDGIIILPRHIPWESVLVPSFAKFVIFPSLRGGYSAKAIPTSLGGRDQKVPFPKDWVGANLEALEAISEGLTFVHPGRFLISTNKKENAIAACKKAMATI